MELAGYLLAIIIGLLLSLLGGGGSILTVPVLVYIFHFEPSLATAYSLLIIGFSSLIASLSYLKNGYASPRTALFFSFPSFVMVFIMRKYIMPVIPSEITLGGEWRLSKNLLIMAVFAILMILASFSMIRSKKKLTENIDAITKRMNYPLIFTEGLIVGTLTGFVGVGGGFLIIPVLTIFINLPMKMAVGTSLMIIAINSLFGFMGDLGKHAIDFVFISKFIGLTLIGVILGTYASRHINNKQLKPAFGWLILFLGIVILSKEIFLNH